uniref:Uncharacterized protein n=1 Tax=Arundo donax TaxID=35708 RepID=A0A0A9BK29_ARUDO
MDGIEWLVGRLGVKAVVIL